MNRAAEEPTPITAEGLAALQAELADLRARRPALVDRVSSARAEGDLRENFAYHDGRRDLGFLDGRIQTIEAILANVVVIEARAATGEVGLGSTVVVEDEFGESTYSLVGPTEADLKRGLISMESPLGRALIGAMVGEEVSFETPGGSRGVKVVSIS